MSVCQTIPMVISEMLHSLLEGALEIWSIFAATVTAIQFSKEIFHCKLVCVIEVKDEVWLLSNSTQWGPFFVASSPCTSKHKDVNTAANFNLMKQQIEALASTRSQQRESHIEKRNVLCSGNEN